MKKLIILSAVILTILTGCTSNETQTNNSLAEDSNGKLFYIQEIKSAIDRTHEFDTIEVQTVGTFNGQEQKNIRLLSRNPNMYYFYPMNKEEVSFGAYYENIYIEDENFIGSIRDASFNGGKEGELAFIETGIESIFTEGEFNSNIFYIALIESIDFIESIAKEDNVYTITANEAYFEYVLEQTMENLEKQAKELPEEAQVSISQSIAYFESQENQELVIILTVEDGMVAKMEFMSSMMVSQFAENYTVTEEKILIETNGEITVTRFNDEAIREEILEVYKLYSE